MFFSSGFSGKKQNGADNDKRTPSEEGRSAKKKKTRIKIFQRFRNLGLILVTKPGE